MEIKPIAYIENDYITKFGIPRQSNIVEGLVSKIIFEPEYRQPDSIRGLEAFDYIWLIWGFSEVKQTEFSPTVRPPKLGGNKRMGVFATRSPFRPNSLGLSSVKLEKIDSENMVLYVKGADLMNGTPIYDIKPYVPVSDSHEGAAAGFTDTLSYTALKVEYVAGCNSAISGCKEAVLTEILSNDPRPQYHNDEDRIYGFEFGELEVKFTVKGNVVFVHSIERAVL